MEAWNNFLGVGRFNLNSSKDFIRAQFQKTCTFKKDSDQISLFQNYSNCECAKRICINLSKP